jgi:hypothetical protein
VRPASISSRAKPSSCRHCLNHSSHTWCTGDEQQLVVRRRVGLQHLLLEQLRQVQVAAVGQPAPSSPKCRSLMRGNLPTGAGRLPLVRLVDRLDQLVLAHRRAAGHVEPLRQLVQVLLAGVGVDAAGVVPGPPSLGPSSSLGSQWSPTFSNAVLDRRERRARSPALVAVVRSRSPSRTSWRRSPGPCAASAAACSGSSSVLGAPDFVVFGMPGAARYGVDLHQVDDEDQGGARRGCRGPRPARRSRGPAG